MCAKPYFRNVPIFFKNNGTFSNLKEVGSVMMAQEEIIRRLRELRYMPRITDICRMGNLDRSMVYDAIRTGRMSERYRAALERVLRFVGNGLYENSRPPT
jgi:hypothetical protein